jgi:hypothetical protein
MADKNPAEQITDVILSTSAASLLVVALTVDELESRGLFERAEFIQRLRSVATLAHKKELLPAGAISRVEEYVATIEALAGIARTLH